jgi:hypothetical protein
MKIETDILSSILAQELPEDKAAAILRKVIKEQEAVVEEEQAEKEKTKEQNPKVAKKFVFAITSSETPLPKDLVGFLFQMPEETPTRNIERQISEAAQEFNQTRKGKKNPVKTVGEAVEVISPKIFKNAGVDRKAKVAIEVVSFPNKLKS